MSIAALSLTPVPSSDKDAVHLWLVNSTEENAFCNQKDLDYFTQQMIDLAKKGSMSDNFFCRVCQTIFHLLPPTWFDVIRGRVFAIQIPRSWIEQFSVDFFSKMPAELHEEIDWVKGPFKFDMAMFLFIRGFRFLENFFSEHSLPPSIIQDRKPVSITACIGENLKRNPDLSTIKGTNEMLAKMDKSDVIDLLPESIIPDLSKAMHVCIRLLNSSECKQEDIADLMRVMMCHVVSPREFFGAEKHINEVNREAIENVLLKTVLHLPQDKDVILWNELHDMIFARNYRCVILTDLFLKEVITLISLRFKAVHEVLKQMRKKPKTEHFKVQLGKESIMVTRKYGVLQIDSSSLVQHVANSFTPCHSIVENLGNIAAANEYLAENDLVNLLKEIFKEACKRAQDYTTLLHKYVQNDGHKNNLQRIQKAIAHGNLPRGYGLIFQVKFALIEYSNDFRALVKDFAKLQAKNPHSIFIDLIGVVFMQNLTQHTEEIMETFEKEVDQIELITNEDAIALVMKMVNFHDFSKTILDGLNQYVHILFEKIDRIVKNAIKKAPEMSSERLMLLLFKELKNQNIDLQDEGLERIKHYFKSSPAKIDLKTQWEALLRQAFEAFNKFFAQHFHDHSDKDLKNFVTLVERGIEKSAIDDSIELYKTYFFSPKLRAKNYALCDFAIQYEIIDFLIDNNGWSVGPLGTLKFIRGIWEKKYPHFPFNEQHAYFFILNLFNKKEREATMTAS